MYQNPLIPTFFLSLGVLLCVAMPVSENNREVVEVGVGLDCTLDCTARSKPGVQYVSVKWYKKAREDMSTRHGLVAKDLPNGRTRKFEGLERQVELKGESSSIVLTNVTCGDGGVYMCHLSAPVGEQNRDGQVRLVVTDCPVSSKKDLMTDACLMIIASAVLIVALTIYIISYCCLKNTIKEGNKTTKKEILLNAPLKPLDKKDLMLIYTLGPKTSSLKHICV